MNEPEFVYVSYIETTPERLWRALTTSECSRRYWWDTDVMTHEGSADNSVILDGISKGWPAILKSLQETGQPLMIPFDALSVEELEEADLS